MNEAIKAILYELPSYLFNLVRLLTNPARYVAGIEFKDEIKHIQITKALTFACVSYVLTEVLASVNLQLNPGVNLSAYYAVRFVISMVTFVGMLVALTAAIRLTGGNVTTDRLLVIHAYYFGTLLVLFYTLLSIPEGWLAFRKRWEQATYSSTETVSWLIGLGCVVMLIWGTFAWQAYPKIASLRAGRSFRAMALSLLFCVPVLALNVLMSEAFVMPSHRSLGGVSQGQFELPPLTLATLQSTTQGTAVTKRTRYGGPLIGTWTAHGLTLEESYVFREDGTFRHLLVGSGQLISGGVRCEDTYTVNGNALILRVASGQSNTRGTGSDARPCNPVQAFKFHLTDRDRLVLDGTGGGTFERLKKSVK
jgi:hypothetical protein